MNAFDNVDVDRSSFAWTNLQNQLPIIPVDFGQKEAIEFVIENRTTDPTSPVTGQLWIRTDL